MKPPFFAEFIAEGRWRAMEMVCGQRPNAVLETLWHVFVEKLMLVEEHERLECDGGHQ